MSAKRTASQILPDIAAFAAWAKAVNPLVRVWWATMAPKTNGSNVASGLFAAGVANGRDLSNSELRGNSAAYGLSGQMDVAAAVEDAAQKDRWAIVADTSDYLHSTQGGP